MDGRAPMCFRPAMRADYSKATSRGGAGFVEFVVLMAATMALGALGIDAMLPNLPAIGHTMGVADENKRQLIITVYLLAVAHSGRAGGHRSPG